ncbi:MAG: mechanosensitive ion channel [Rhodospirillaceae bacterium]|nr:mechanosensitive ion channel [Rhodospirillaceae bacterium]
MNGNLSQIVVQLLIGFLPAAVLLFSMRLNYLKQSYSYRDDGFSSVGAALTESAKLKLVVTAGFLFFQSLVLIIYAPPSFIFVFVLAIIMINVAAMVCMATNYQMADHLIAQIRKSRTLGNKAVIDQEVSKYLSKPIFDTDHLLRKTKFEPRNGRFTNKKILLMSLGMGVLICFPFLGISWIFIGYPKFGAAFIALSGFEDFGFRLVDSVLIFALANYGLGGECVGLSVCSPSVQSFIDLTSSTSYRILLFVYFFFISFPIIRFISSLREYDALLQEKNTTDLGLETDVVQNIGYIVSILGSLLISLLLVKVPVGEIGVFSGIVAAGVSLALRDTLGNLMAGALLIWDGSLKKGDVITIPQTDTNDTGSTYGIIREMKMRYTVVEDRNTVRRLIPNSLLVTDPIESWTHDDTRVRLSLNIGVAYGTELAKAKQIMESVCYDVRRILTDKTPQALVVNFGENSIDFSLRFWLRDTSDGIRPVISEVLMNISQRFEEEGIEIPFPQRSVWIRENKPLKTASRTVPHDTDSSDS